MAQEQQSQGSSESSGSRWRIDTRWAAGNMDRMQAAAKELVGLQPDVLLSASTPATAALAHETQTIPIVFALVNDPIGSGFAATLPRPGGNITGFGWMEGPNPSHDARQHAPAWRPWLVRHPSARACAVATAVSLAQRLFRIGSSGLIHYRAAPGGDVVGPLPQ